MIDQPVAQVGKYIELRNQGIGVQFFVELGYLPFKRMMLMNLAIDFIESIVMHHLLFRTEMNLRVRIQRLDQPRNLARAQLVDDHVIKVVDQVEQIAMMRVDDADSHAQLFVPGYPAVYAMCNGRQIEHLGGIDDVVEVKLADTQQ